ncbi:MAG: ABC transporter permease [Parvularculaceae bacterium]|nr:ABC transporter permease [Parvularculaceae bacterium]
MLLTSFFLAVRQIRRHVLRSSLTVLGVVIGVFSVVVMVTLGDGATASVKSSISALGSDILQVFPGQGRRGSGSRSAPPFKTADIAAIRGQIGGVVAVAGQAQTAGLAVRNAQSWSTTITGTSNEYFKALKLTVVEGRIFSALEEEAGRRVCVIGATIVKNLFQDVSPVGQSFRIKGVSCDVIGVLAARGQSGFGNDQDDVVLMPMKAVQRQMLGSQDIQGLAIGVDPAFDSTQIQQSLVALLRERRALSPGEDDDFTVLDARQISDTISGTVRILTLLVGAVAGVSLLVGGIGIMNIMLVSVTERTREIGIRLAIGARGEEVLTQFLVEAIVLSCIGGVVGLALALVVSAAVAPLIGVPFLFNPGVNALAFGFSAAIGVIFGYFPARRAVALDPIEALRSD